MGRSQLQYRRSTGNSTHSNSSRRGENKASRPLPNNAYRFQEQDDQPQKPPTPSVSTSLHNFNFTGSSVAVDHYHQTHTIKDWEQNEINDSPLSLDFDAIGEQLKRLPVDIQYRVDPKYCVNFPRVPTPIESVSIPLEKKNIVLEAAAQKNSNASIHAEREKQHANNTTTLRDCTIDISTNSKSISDRNGSKSVKTPNTFDELDELLEIAKPVKSSVHSSLKKSNHDPKSADIEDWFDDLLN